MRTLISIFTLVKTLACAAFVFALVLLPPSASHASVGMNDGHHAVPDEPMHSVAKQDRDGPRPVLSGERCGSIADPAGQDHTPGECCSGMCGSVALNEVVPMVVEHTEGDSFGLLREQASSVEPSGFLRPPQHLI